MYIYYSIGNNSGPQTLVRIVEVFVMERVCFRRFHYSWQNGTRCRDGVKSVVVSLILI